MPDIEVFFIGLEDEPDNGYYEKDIEQVSGAIEALEPHATGYVIRKTTMDREKFNNLPEFTGF